MAEIMRMGLKFQLFHAGDGPLRGALERQMEELGLNGKVHFLGTRRDIMALMQRSSFLVHTADDEGCPNVVMEAMACGRAVVATDAGDVPHLVKNGETGFVVSRRDDTRLVKSVAKLISRYDLVCRMGIAGRLKAEQEFGLDRLLSETFAVYRAAGWVGD
jgi:glycosyltransferase involved in cell wall biosynthesis